MILTPRSTESTAAAPIKWKLVRTTGGVIAALVIFQVIYFPARQAQHSTDALRSKAESIASLVANNTASALDFGDVAAAQEGFKGARADPDLEFLLVFRKNGQPFTTFGTIPKSLPVVRDELITPDRILVSRPITSAGAASGRLVAGFSRKRIAAQATHDQIMAISTGVLVLLLALAGAYFLAEFAGQRMIELTRTAEQMATGRIGAQDREEEPTSLFTALGQSLASSDEMERLTAAFRNMASNLKSTVAHVKRSQTQLSSVFEDVGAGAAEVTARADDQARIGREASVAVQALDEAIANISRNVRALSEAAEETASSIYELDAAFSEVARRTETMTGSVSLTVDSTSQMAAAIRDIDAQADELRNFVSETSASIVQMDASIQRIESTAAKSSSVAADVARAADSATSAARDTIASSERIRTWFEEINAALTSLGERSNQIGAILTVIGDVARQTNLLAFNAAILAAQAGEHGAGFSVVAQEIRELAERTSKSANEIRGLIGSVQTEVQQTRDKAAQGLDSVRGGLRLSHEVGDQLQTIQDLARTSSEVGQVIAQATREQTQSSRFVAEAVARLQDLVGHISAATSRQANGSTAILAASETTIDSARKVAQATTEQQAVSRRLAEFSQHVLALVESIVAAVAHHAGESGRLGATIDHVREIASQNKVSAETMERSISLLRTAVSELDQSVSRFTLD